jgi:GAF domain-containing protein
MEDEGRRRRILAEIGHPDSVVQANDVALGVCHFAVESLAASGCAVTLMASPPSVDVLAVAGRNADEIAELQFSLGEGPCLDAFLAGVPTFAVDLATRGARWPMFSTRAAELGVLAEFSLPLQLGAAPVGVLDLSREEPGMLSDEHLADALTAAEIVTDAVLLLQGASDGSELATLLEPAGLDRVVVHQATGMVSAQLDVTIADALATLRAAAFRSDRSIYDISVDVVDRRMSFRG